MADSRHINIRGARGLFVGLGILLLALILSLVLVSKDKAQILSPAQANELIELGAIKSGEYSDDFIYFSVQGREYKLSRLLPLKTADSLSLTPRTNWSGILLGVLIFFSLLSFVVVWLFFKRSIKFQNLATPTTQEGAKGFLQSTNPLDDESVESQNVSDVKFSNVAGIDEVKEELLEVIDYLKNPKKYQDLGIKLPKGILLVGAPGVGKTMIAKAMANEAGVPFFYKSGSSFAQIYVGMGAKRVRELFLKAKAKAPSIIFIDEIDALGKARGGARSDEREATLNQLLTEMDGFEERSGVIVMAATNKIEVLDEALLRPARFDRHIYVELPNLKEREQILALYLKGKTHSLDLGEVARLCVGFSGAALALLINEAALYALRRGAKHISLEDILSVKDKVQVGKRKSVSLSEKEREILAFYQGAKGLCAYFYGVEFEKITLVGESMKPLEKALVGKNELLNLIKVALCGNLALMMKYQQSFSNAKEDIKRAKAIAKQMCEEYGMGESLLGGEREQAMIFEGVCDEVEEFLTRSKSALERIAAALMRQERLSKEEIGALYEESV